MSRRRKNVLVSVSALTRADKGDIQNMVVKPKAAFSNRSVYLVNVERVLRSVYPPPPRYYDAGSFIVTPAAAG